MLVTGDSKDVQFDLLTREYKFGIAVFDNAQIEHSWSPALLRLSFKQEHQRPPKDDEPRLMPGLISFVRTSAD